MAKIKIGIVEDEMIIAQGIMKLLEELGYETTEPAISYTEALGMIVSEQPVGSHISMPEHLPTVTGYTGIKA